MGSNINELDLLLKEAERMLMEGKFKEATKKYYKVLEGMIENREAESGAKYSRYWQNRIIYFNNIKNEVEKAKFLSKHWKQFIVFLKSLERENKEPINYKLFNIIKQYIFSTILNIYLKVFNSQSLKDTTILLAIGTCYIELGDYEKAKATLEYAQRLNRSDPNIMLRLADVYYKIGKYDMAKFFIREAFTYFPDAIDIGEIRNDIVHSIISYLEDKNIARDKGEIPYLIGPYGVILGYLNVVPELDKDEVKNIQKFINTLQNEIAINKNNRKTIGKLLNFYLLLYDYEKYQKRNTKACNILKEEIKKLLEKLQGKEEKIAI